VRLLSLAPKKKKHAISFLPAGSKAVIFLEKKNAKGEICPVFP